MRPLSDLVPVFAKLDRLVEEDMLKLDKGLRNLTQRAHLPPTDQRGRVFLYDNAAICSIRLAYLAHECGLDRLALEPFTRWMTKGGTRRKKVDGGHEGVWHIQEAIERVANGETFNFEVIFLDNGRIRCDATWSDDNPLTDREEQAIRNTVTAEEIARFSMPASRLIRLLLAELD